MAVAKATTKIPKCVHMSSRMLQREIPEIIAAYRVMKLVVHWLKFTWNFKVHNKISIYC